MTWFLRDSDQAGQGPIYPSGADLFTIKIHGGGQVDSASRKYVGGGFRYIDNCDVDELSILELGTMLQGCFGHLGYTEFCYKLSLPPVIKVQPGRPKKKRNNKNDVPTDPTKLRRKNTFVYCKYWNGKSHNARTYPAKKLDVATKAPGGKGNTKATLGRINKQKKKKNVACKGKDTISTPRNENPMDAIYILDVQGYQGGIFTSYSRPARMDNTPLGIQRKRFMVRGNHVTTLRQIEAEANARKAALAKRPP